MVWVGPVMRYRLYLVFFLSGACGSDDSADRLLRLAFHAPESCPAEAALNQLTLEARGDFPSSGAFIAPFDRPIGPSVIDQFPLSTETLVATGSGPGYLGEGATAGLSSGGEDLPLVLAPPGETCPLVNDFAFRHFVGSALVDTGVGGALLLGGVTGAAEGSRRILRLPADLAPSETLSPLAVARIGATATRSGLRTVVAGGAIFDDERALDTYLVLDAQTGTVLRADSALCPESDPTCVGRRRDHGAVALADGRVLLFGGVERAGADRLADEILNTAVLVDPATGEVDTNIDLSLEGGGAVRSRRLPTLLTLDSGVTYVVGGQGEGGGWTGTVYRFDALARRFVEVERVDDGVPLPSSRVLPFVEGASVALPGARIAFVSGASSIAVLRFSDSLDRVWRIDVPVSFPNGPLNNVRAHALPDGTLFVAGSSAAGQEALHIDLGAGTVELLAPTLGTVEDIVPLGTGALLELTAAGPVYRRVILRTRFDNPPVTLLPEDYEWLSYDASPGWVIEPTQATASRPATVALAGLRLRDFRLTVAVTSGVTLRLTEEGPAPTAVNVHFINDTVSVGLCEAAWDGGTATVSRSGAALRINTAGSSVECELPTLDQAVSAELRLESGAAFRTLRLNRM